MMETNTVTVNCWIVDGPPRLNPTVLLDDIGIYHGYTLYPYYEDLDHSELMV